MVEGFGSPDPQITAECGGDIPPSRMIVGNDGYSRSEVEVRIRDIPSVNGTQLSTLPPYENFPSLLFEVVDGPVCADGYAWWQIYVEESDLLGWSAEAARTDDGDEYWLEPVYTPNF